MEALTQRVARRDVLEPEVDPGLVPGDPARPQPVNQNARPVIGVRKFTLTPVASRISAVLTGEQHALIGPLMEGLHSDLLPRAELASDTFGVRLHSLDSAIERALRDWERDETLRAR